jgi:uncharacterized ubiquitin-like protein YukD
MKENEFMEEIKKVPVKVPITVKEYRINFTYETRRGHYRTQTRTIEHLNEDSALEAFKEWGKTIRTMSNVKILGITDTNTTRTIEVAL